MNERDPRISAAYRAAPHPEVPAALDRRVLEAAERAVRKPARPHRGWLVWGVPLSTAAVLVLAVTLMFEMRREAPELATVPPAHLASSGVGEAGPATREAASAGQNTPAPSPAGPATAIGGAHVRAKVAGQEPTKAVREAKAPMRPEKRLSEPFPRQAKMASVPSPVSAAPVPSHGPGSAAGAASALPGTVANESAQVQAAAAAPTTSAASLDNPSRIRAQVPAEQAVAPTRVETGRTTGFAEPQMSHGNTETAPSSGSSARSEDRLEHPQSAAEREVAKIERLVRAGHLHEARLKLKAFRKTHPDYVLPDDLKKILPP